MAVVKPTAAPTRIRSVSRAVDILLHLAGQEDGRTAKEIALAVRVPVATTYHLLNTLVGDGILAKDSKRQYHLGPKIGALSDSFLRRVTPPEYLLVPLRQLAEATGETAYVSGWRLGEIVVLATVEGSHAVRVSYLHVGFEGFAHARASGKVLLAYAAPPVRDAYLRAKPLEARTPRTIVDEDRLRAELTMIRKRGYALDEGEFDETVGCVSAPVVESGVAIAALGISAPLLRFRTRQRELIEAVLAATRSVGSHG